MPGPYDREATRETRSAIENRDRENLDLKIANTLMRAGIDAKHEDESASDMVCRALMDSKDYQRFGTDFSMPMMAAAELMLSVVQALLYPQYEAPGDAAERAIDKARETMDDMRSEWLKDIKNRPGSAA